MSSDSEVHINPHHQSERFRPPSPNGPQKPSKRNVPPRIRIKLAPISTYAPNMEFSASEVGCSQRVIVRLERLMGSDKIRLTDSNFLRTYLKRLEDEEGGDWHKRKNERKAAEDDRYRKLALDGFIEPTDEMQDLYNHPVFRVNQMLDRLSRIDTGTLNTHLDEKIPPVEPFMYDGDLRNYRVNPPRNAGVRRARREWEIKPLEGIPDDDDDDEAEVDDEDEDGSQKPQGPVYGPENKKQPTVLEILEENARINSGHGVTEVCEDEQVEDEDGEIKTVTVCQVVEMGKPDEPVDPLPKLQKRLGIPDNVDLKKMFAKYQSENVDAIFDDELQSSKEIFEKSQKIIDAYKRQSLYGEDFIQELNKQIY